MLQEFDIEIRDKKGVENVVADHLSRINHGRDGLPIEDALRDDTLYAVLDEDSWMRDVIRAIRGEPLPHLNYRPKLRNTIRVLPTYIDMDLMESLEDVCQQRRERKF